jgi:glucokinase
MSDLYGAIDLGGTNVRAIVADLDGTICGDDKRPSNADHGLDVTLAAMESSLAQACSEAGVEAASELRAVGIACPGWVDLVEGVVAGAPQLKGWRNVPLVRIMRERLGTEVVMENDANAAALGENVFGAGRGTRHMIYITVSTGVGGGIIIDGKLYGGARGSAGEIGHTVIDPSGAGCGCGNYGCLEALASGTAIARLGAEAEAHGDSPKLTEIKRRDGRITSRAVADAAEKGDAASREIYAQAGRFLGMALANLVNIFSPELILIGGGVSRAAPLFMPEAENMMRALALPESLKHMRLALAELQDAVGVLGMIARMREMA